MDIPKFYIKKGETIKDIYAEWGIVVTDFPYITINNKPKNISSRTYFDEDGDYEFIPDEIKYHPQEFTINFAYKGAKDSANTAIASFLNYIVGEISLYSEFAKIGRQKCRVIQIEDGSKLFRANKDVALFSVRFKSNDPNNNITLSL